MMDLNHRISKLSPEQRKIFKLKLEQEGIDISRISSPGISESQLSQGTSPHPPGREKSIYHPIEPTEEKEYYPLSAAQKRMYILNLFVEYNLRLVFQVDGNLDRNRFRQVFRQLVKRHESFRTSFQLMAGEPVQKIHDHVVVDMEYHDLSTQAQEVNSIISRFFRGVDLSVPPLLRVGLIRLSAARYIYLVNIHHIIADGTSIGLLAREFVPLYQGKELSALKIRYKDYSQWQNRLFNTGEYKKKEAYWLELFSGELPVLNMPTDYPRPPMQSFEGRRVCFSIAGETFRSLKSLAAKQKVSIYMLLMAVYNALLFRYTGQEDIVIGTIAAGRQQRELESLFGVFINALTIRNYPEKSKTFKGFLGEIKQNTLDAYENQLYPFGDLLDQVVKNKDLSRNPLFDVMFIFQNVDMRTRWEMKDLGFVLSRYEYSSSHYAQQDITLWAAMEGDQIRMDLDYCKVLFKPETMECFTRHFLTFLTGAVANPDLELAGIEMINPEERHRLLVEFNNTSIPFPEGKSIRELFADQVEKKPHHISLISSEPWEVSLTYRELDRRADQLACLLRKKGTQADTIVGIMMERSIEMVIGVTAVLKAGGAYLPLDTAYPGERIRYMLSDSGSRLLLTTRQVLTESEKIGKWEGETVFMEADAGNTGAAASFPPPTPWRENSLVYVIYTSGSTGKPKGVMVQQGNFVNATFGWRKEYKLRYMEVNLLQIASFSFDVFAGDFARALFNGGKLVICPEETRVDPPSLYSLIRKQRITLFESTPSLVIPFMEYVYENRLAIDNLKLLIIGSDICRTADFKRLISRFGSQMRIINSYGVTEAAVDSSYYEETLEHIPPVGSVPIGKPMPNMTFFVLDYGKKLQPIGIPGELCIGGAGVTRGYLSNPELTNKKFLRGGPGGAVFSKSAPPGRRRQKLYKTGDLARWLADGNVEILGRIDHQVKIRGFRIELVELESQLLKYPGIKEAVVTARKNNVENISLCAYYVANREGTFEIPTNDRLREYLFQSLPDYMIPSYYVNLDKIPLTPNGKIDRTALPEPEPGVVSEQYVPPTNNIQKHLVNVWQEVLGVESIGINDNFFKIGGDSIKAIQVSTRLKKYGLDLKVNDLFLHPVIKEAEKCIKETGDEQKTPQSPGQEKKELTPRDMDLESRIPKEDLARINNYITSSIDENPEIQLIYPLSPMQNGMLYHWLRNEKSDSYFSQGVFTIEGEIEKSTLEDTFNQLIERYDILRTIFVYEDLEEPLQVVLNNRKARVYDEDITHLSENQGNLYLEEFKRKDKQRGFDLTRDILMRLSLFKTGFKDYCLVWSFHHILMDGWCLGIIFKDFIEIYHSLKQGKRVELPAVIPYINYIRWLEKQEKTAGLKYWQQYLEGYEEPVGLPKLGNLKRNDDYKLEEYDLIIDEKRVSALNSIARQEGVTVNTVFQTLWSVLLQRYNNTDEVVFGVVVSGRPPEIQGIEQMVGLFINTIPIRIKSRPDREFSQLLRMVQQKGALSRPYEYLPLAEIQSKSQLKVNLIDHIMVFENYPIQEEIKNAGIEPEYDFRAVNVRIHEQTNYNFNIVIFPGQYFLVKFSYNGLVYEGNLIKRVGLHLEEMIKQVIENPSKTIKEIGIITGVEKQQILYDFNQTAVKYPKEKTIHELFERQVEKTPDHTALTGQIPGKFGGSVSLTYKELNKKSNRLARILHEKGVESDTIVGVMVERSIEMIVGILAILKAGGAFLLIDPEYPRERIDYMLKDSNVSLLLTGLELLEDCKGTACCAPTASPAACNLPLSLAYIIYTSGTTGKPKGVMIQHQSLVNLCSWHNRYFQVKESDHATQYAKISFDASVWEIFPYLIKGASLTIIDTDIKLDIEKLNEFFETHDITIGFLPTQLCEQFMELENRSLRKLLTGGDRLGKFIKRDYQLYNNYGPTEDTVVNTSFPVNRYHINIPIGRPVDNNRIYILDKNGLFPQPIGIPGELCIAGDGLARGYLNNPELTAEKFFNYRSYSLYFSKKIYRTGDLARWLADGNIEFLGRIDLQVKIRGVRIELGEIENQLLNHKEIKEAVVIDKKTQDGDKYLCAYIVSDRELIPAELKKYLSGTMPDYMIPSYFVSIEKVPLTSSGKIDRKALPEPGVKPTGITIVPRNRVEKKLAEIWSEILISDVFATIGIDDNFFERGGHSLKATTLTAKIHKEFNVKIPLAQIFKTPVIRELAEIIKKAARNRFAAVEPVEKKDFYPLSSAQRRLYILQQMELNTTVYNIPQVVVLEGAINKRLKDTINRLIRRHEGLRTSFAVVDEEPVQKINPEVNFGLVEIEHCSVTDLPGIVTNFIRPFDLSQAPLLRVGLIETGEREHILMVDIHHIIADGVSHALLVKDFMALYGGEEGKLAKIPIQYKDYSQWQHSERQKEAVKKQETYWLKQFQGDIPVLDLPTDYPRPAIQSFEGNTLAFEIGSKEARALKELTHPAGVTLFMVLVSLFDILLLKLSGHENEDILVGTPISGRRHADLEPVIGMFVNTLVLRNSPHGHLTFEEFLNQVKETSIQAFENQDYLFEDLVDHPGLDIKRDPGRNPLFDVVFTFQNLDIPVLQVPGLKLKPYQDENIIKTAKFDITLTAQERGETLYFTFEYCTRLFKQETMARFAKYFQNIVSSVLENPGKKISGIEIILEEEKEQILFDFNNPSPLYPKEKTIHELFEKQVEKTTDNIALVGNVSITYNELNQRSDQLAHLLRAKGVKADTIVSIMVERSIEMIVGILAILKAGGAYLPISTDYPGERINYMLAESKTNLLLTTRTPAEPGEKVEKWKGEKIFLEDFKLPYSSHSSYLSHLSGNLAYIIYTSGTTGKPKGVMVRHFNVVRLVKNTNYIEFKEGDRILQTGALEFDASTFEIWGSLLNGLELSLVKNKIILSPGKLKDTIERNRITTIWLTAPLFNHLLDEEIEIFRGLRNLLVGGDVLSPSHINRLRNEFPRLNIINGYGPTENTTFSTTFLIDREYHESIPIGKPIANSTAYIVDKYGYLQPVGIAGELWVGGDGVVRGYLNNPELTIERFCLRRPGGRFLKKLPPWTPRKNFSLEESNDRCPMTNDCFYRTGDLARWLVDGNIEFLGRRDHQVKIRGFRIELGEIESQLLKHSEIKEAVVLYKTDKSGDKYLCAYIVSSKQGLELELKNYLSHFMPDYMIPSYFVQIEKIPLNPNGKIDRNALPEPETGQTCENYIAPRHEIERKLVDIWAEVLGRDAWHASQLRESISINDHFFDLGGHSLKATLMTAKIYKQLNINILLAEVFKTPTIRGLARHIKEVAPGKYEAVKPVEKKEYYELSSAQKRLYILQQMDLDSTAYNMPQSIPLAEEPDRERMEKVFIKLIERHESLRTSFFLLGEEPVQRIYREVKFEIRRMAAAEEAEERKFVRPFDLSQPPLLRVGLIKPGENQHILMVDMHHIVTDGISQTILQKEFITLTSEPGKDLPALRLQYKDYARWLNSRQQQELMKKQESYWVRFFSLTGELPVLNLPTDYPRPLIQSFEGCSVDFVFTHQEAQILTDTAKKAGATLYMVILSVYTILLAKLSGQEDIIVGTPIAARRHADLEGIIGMFVNTLAMRNYLIGHKTFKEFLIEVKNRTLEAYENQEYPFEELVEKVSPRRDTSRNPIFDVVFNLLNEAEYSENNEVPGIGPDQSYIHRPLPGTSKFDLTLTAIEIEKGLIFNFQYCTKLFKPGTIERFIGYFKKVVSTLQENPEVTLSRIEIISAEEKRQVLYDFNGKEAKYLDNKTIHELFAEQVIRTPHSIAIAGMDDEAWQGHRSLPAAGINDSKMKGIRTRFIMPVTPTGNIYITYHELNEKSDQLAHHLCQEGVKANNLVGIMMERSVEMIIGILGILKAGGAYVPLNPKAPPARNTYILDECGVSILLTPSSLSDSKGESFYSPPGTQPAIPSLQPAANLAYVIFTSGSTGIPKGVPISHSNLSPLLHWGYKHLGLGAKDRTIQNLAYYFDWSVWEIFITLTSGACLYPVSEEVLLNPQTCIDFMDKHTVTVLHATPTQYQYLVNTPVLRRGRKLETLTYLFIGAEKLTYDLVHRSFESVNNNCRVFNMYGPTEATIISAVLEIQRSDYQRFHDLSSVPIGEPVANAVLLILDKYFKLSPVNIVGELYIGGDGIACGYLNNPELTSEKFFYRSYRSYMSYISKNFYKTGDLTRWLPDGNIEFLGRIDHQVKIRGFRIELGEIENRLLDHEGVREVVVIDSDAGQGETYLCAYIVPQHVETPGKTETGSLSKELAGYLAGILPDYMIPSHFIEIDNIPLNPNGKVDRKALPRPGLLTGVEYAAPRDRLEEKLVEIWSEVLREGFPVEGVESPSIGIDDNFFELGGHSLKAVGIAAKIHKELEVKLSLVEIFTSPTIREMAAAVATIAKKQGKHTYKDIKKIEEKEFYEISHFQRRLWVFNRAHPGDISYNMPDRIVFNRQVDEEIIRKVLFKIVERHRVFRTSFREVDGQPVQVIEKDVDMPFRVIDISLMAEGKKQQEREKIIAGEVLTPFDLSRAPIFRSVLVKSGPDRCDFIFNMYHIIADGWSMEIVKKDFRFLYEGFRQGKGMDPGPLQLQYTDFAAWQNQQVKDPAVGEKAHKYWQGKLEEGFPPLRLPYDYPENPHHPDNTGAAYRFVICRDTRERLKTLAADHHTSLFIVMFSLLNLLLARLSGQKDIVCRIPTGGRHHISMHPIVGYFINPIFVKNRVEDNDENNFIDFLHRVDANTLEAFQHQWYPLERVVEEHRLPYPDVAISFNMLNMIEGTALTDLDNFDSFHSERITEEKFPLILQFIEFRNGIEMFLRYRKALFKPSTIERMVAQYKELSDEMAGIAVKRNR